MCDVRPQHSKKQAKAATLNGLQYLIILIAIIKQKRLVDLFFLNAFVRVFVCCPYLIGYSPSVGIPVSENSSYSNCNKELQLVF